MKNLFKSIILKKQKKESSQQDLIDFIKDTENLKKAAEGSMRKRLDLIERVELKQSNCTE